MRLPCNEHPIERGFRAVLGLGLIALAVTGVTGAWAWIGVVPLLTAATGFCPLYTLIGVNTCPANTTG